MFFLPQRFVPEPEPIISISSTLIDTFFEDVAIFQFFPFFSTILVFLQLFCLSLTVVVYTLTPLSFSYLRVLHFNFLILQFDLFICEVFIRFPLFIVEVSLFLKSISSYFLVIVIFASSVLIISLFLLLTFLFLDRVLNVVFMCHLSNHN